MVSFARWITATAAMGLAGCSALLGIDDPTPAEGADAMLAPDAETLTACSNGELVGSAIVDTSNADDSYRPSCGDSAGNDVALAFVAPATDYYVFSTAGSSFDTVLTLRDRCAGDELGCSNNVGMSAQSELIRKVTQGSSLLVTVDGFAGARGSATIAATPVACPNQDVEGQTFPLSFTTAGAGNDVAMACGTTASPGEDSAFHWVAPSDGLYAFRATSSDFTPTVAVTRGPRCSDAALGCNAAAIRTAEVVRRVTAGEVLSVIVDTASGAGPFDLTIEPREGECPEGGALPASIDAESVVTATFNGRTLAPSCAPIQLFDRGGGVHEMGDMTYSLMKPIDPTAFSVSCDVAGTSAEPFVLYAVEGTTCAGNDSRGDCVVSRPDTSNPDQHEARLLLTGDKDESIPYTIVVAGNSVTPAPVTLTTGCHIILASRGTPRSR